MHLENRVIIVTGAARGLGKVYALALAKEGAKVIVADILGEQVEQTASEIREAGGISIAVKADVSIEADTISLAEIAKKSFGRIDVLVNNAALLISKRRPFFEVEVEEWDRYMSVNVRGTWLCTKAVFPYMKEQHSGKIVNIASSTFFSGTPAQSQYVTSKGAVIGFTRAICRELGQFNITVNALAPGFTLTEAARSSTEGEKYEALIAQSRALKRNELPEDLAGAMIFLCSSDSDFMTGQTVLVEGGRVLH